MAKIIIDGIYMGDTADEVPEIDGGEYIPQRFHDLARFDIMDGPGRGHPILTAKQHYDKYKAEKAHEAKIEKRKQRQEKIKAELQAKVEQRANAESVAEHSAWIAANWPDSTPEPMSFWEAVGMIVIAVFLCGVFLAVFIGLALLMGIG